MKTTWFKRIGPVYLPIHGIGLMISLAAIVQLVIAGIAIMRSVHSVNEQYCILFIYTSCTAFWWKWIADKTSEK